ncbi:MAG: peptide chain release factor 2 [Alphaproteobacteria bacterium 13_2_20CM_2_64_7]|nr:MAG: peptide chain release factor 2 [Alphaproteobacteria bacterium 13_2_20CM_2_64_7]
MEHAREETMRAEVENIVDEIKQSVGLLRRHL